MLKKFIVSALVSLSPAFLTLANAKTVAVIMDAYDGGKSIFNVLELNQRRDSLDFVVLKKEVDLFRRHYHSNSLVCETDSFSHNEISRCLHELSEKRNGLDFITIASRQDWLVYRASKFRSIFNTKAGNRPDTAALFFDKYLMKRKIISAGIQTAEMIRADSKSIYSFIKKHHFPVVVKPRRESSSDGVKILYSLKELSRTLASIKRDQYIIERFMPGETYRVDGVYEGGQLTAMVAFKDTPSCYEYYVNRRPQVEALILDESRLQDIKKITQKSLSALRYKDGVFHLELIKNAKTGFNFLEIAARPGGGAGRKLLLKHYGIDFGKVMMRLDLGLSSDLPPLPSETKKFGWALAVPAPHPKKSYQFTGLDRTVKNNYPSLVEVDAPRSGRLPKYGSINFYFIDATREERIEKDFHGLLENLNIHFSE